MATRHLPANRPGWLRPVGRVPMVFLALGIGVLSSSAGPLIPTAAAQTTPGQNGYYASPPPYDSSVADQLPPDGPPSPDRPYEKSTDCVTRNLGENVTLQSQSWGQQYLQLDEVHKLMLANTGSIGSGV